MNCAYYQQHGGSHPAHHNVNNNYFNEVNNIIYYTLYMWVFDNCIVILENNFSEWTKYLKLF